jgi:hypothetical protein
MNMAFVMGTGRCGTKSYAYVLNEQKGVKAEHEIIKCNWNYHSNRIDKNIKHLSGILNYHDVYLAVAVALYFLPYAEYLIESYNIKCICLKRNREDTINSYISKFKGRNYFDMNYVNSYYKGWNKCYPKFGFNVSLEDGLEIFYDNYYSISEYLQRRYPDNFKIYNMPKVLTDSEYQLSSLEFIGVKDPVPVLDVKLNKLLQKLRKIHWNPSYMPNCDCDRIYI